MEECLIPIPAPLSPALLPPDLQLLRQVIEASAVGTVITDALQPDWPIVYVNRAFERLTGYTAAESLGQNCRFMQGQDRDQPAARQLHDALDQGQTITVSLRNYRKDGTLFYNEVTLSPVFGADGTVTHHVGFQNDVSVREDALLQNARRQEQLASVLDRVTDGFSSFDRDLNFTYLNPAAARFAGRAAEDLAGQPLFTVLPELAGTAVGQAVQRATETGAAQHAAPQLTPLGRWVDAAVYPSEDGLSVFIRDLTEHRAHHAAQEELRLSEVRFSKVFQASPLPMVITRVSDQRYLDVNAAFASVTGYARTEAIGRTSQELGLWADTGVRTDTIEVVQHGRQVQDREVQFRTRTGEPLDMMVSLVPVELEGEACIVSIARDIGGEKLARRTLEDSEARYRRLAGDLQRTLDLSVDLITSIGPDGRFVTVSAASERILGYAPEELIGRRYLDFVHPDDREQTVRAADSVTEGQPPATFQNRALHKGGQVVWTEWTALRQAGDAQLYGVVRDITQREMAAADIQRLNTHLQLQLDHVTGMREIDQMIASSQELSGTLSVILDNVARQLGADAVTLLLLDPHTLNLEYAGTRGFVTPVQRGSVRLGSGLAGQVALSRQVLSVPDLRTARLPPFWRDLVHREGLRSYAGAPLIARGKVLGVLEVMHREVVGDAAGWQEMFGMLCAQAAIAVDNAGLFRDLETRNLQLRLAYDETIEGWAHALDLRDHETEGHSRRVTEMTVRLCQDLGLASGELVDVRRGALLHDIGKMGIPDAVLLKPGKLTEEEWVLMKRHPEYAVNLLSPIRFLRPALDIPQYHHEKWNGSGYPHGLSGEAIPLVARAFAVVDVYDALTSNRPYREAWTKERALEHILGEAGTHFDPEVVRAFVSLLSSTL
jgi:PAS domain S-box-containing protein